MNENKRYTFHIENKKEEYLIYTGTNKFVITLTIRNNCEYTYPKETEIKCDKDSNIKPKDELIIKNLKPNETDEITICYENLKYFPPGIFNSFFNFKINGEKIGITIVLKLKFLDNKNFELVGQFR